MGKFRVIHNENSGFLRPKQGLFTVKMTDQPVCHTLGLHPKVVISQSKLAQHANVAMSRTKCRLIATLGLAANRFTDIRYDF